MNKILYHIKPILVATLLSMVVTGCMYARFNEKSVLAIGYGESKVGDNSISTRMLDNIGAIPGLR